MELQNCISCGLLRAAHSRNPTGTDFVGLSRRSPHRITHCVCGCGSLLAHIRISRVRASSSYLLPSKSHLASYARFACDESFCVFEELIQKKQASDDVRQMCTPVLDYSIGQGVGKARICSLKDNRSNRSRRSLYHSSNKSYR